MQTERRHENHERPTPLVVALAIAQIACANTDAVSSAQRPVAAAASNETVTAADHAARPLASPGTSPPQDSDRDSPTEAIEVVEAIHLDDDIHEIPNDAPSAFVAWRTPHQPEAPAVLFLHGWRGCATVLALPGEQRCSAKTPVEMGWGLVEAFLRSSHPGVFLLPQLSWRRRSGSPGKLRRPGFASQWLDRALGEAARQRSRDLPRRRNVVVIAHSAGFESALALLDDDGLQIEAIVLLDALYAGEARFERWALEHPDRRLVLVYTGHGTTARKSVALGARLRALLPEGDVSNETKERFEETIARHRVALLRSPTQHGDIPSRHLAELLRGLRIPFAHEPRDLGDSR